MVELGGGVMCRVTLEYLEWKTHSTSKTVEHIIILEKWFPLQGERGHSSYFRCFQKQNREEGETE